MKDILVFNLFILLVFSAAGQDSMIQGRWKGEIQREGKNWSVEVNIRPTDQGFKGDFDLPDYGLHHLVFSDIQLDRSTIRLKYSDKNSVANFHGALDGKRIMGDWEGLGIKATFVIKKESDIALQYRTEEIVIANSDATLAGTLVLPNSEGPFPAIVQVHGSGNQTRTEDFYRSRAYLFARNGIAVLIYDRRGKGLSTGTEVSMELLADDAIAGVHWLQNHKSIAKDRVGIMGFSQGGYVAPLAASRSKDITFLIVGSAPGVTPDEQNDFDVQNALRRVRLPEDSIVMILKFRKELRDYQYNSVGDKSRLESSLSSFRSKRWFKSALLSNETVGPSDEGVKKWLSFDPLPVWRQVSVPKLMIWGELDNVVPVAKSKKLIEAALIDAGSKNFEILIYKNASHGISIVDSGKEWDWPRLAIGYHNALISWTRKTVK